MVTSTDAGKPPSIAVLPFLNLSNDDEQEYFADGITEDIISNLSLWKTFPVISRNSSFSFKGAKKIRRIASKLGADYLVEGVSERRNKVRITAQLTFAPEEKQIWSKRWDRSLEDIFDTRRGLSRCGSFNFPALKDQSVLSYLTNQKILGHRMSTSRVSYLQRTSVYRAFWNGYRALKER